ncbi:MAG: acyl-CoA dehydrogenase [Gammaproteobacteria bacterium]|nr:MAG: acyl-CoA dehydrogenase [Gammaproteobacteria bacterium]
MNFEFSEEHHLLRDQAQSYLSEQSSVQQVRAVLDTEESYDHALWQGLGELGWLGASIPEQYGGVGLDYLSLCVIAQELGRSLAPTPFSSSIYLAAEAILLAGTEQQKEIYLPKLASGEWIGTFAIAEQDAVVSPTQVKTILENDGLSGRKCPVPDGDVADFAVVVAKENGVPSWFIVDLDNASVTRETIKTLDPTRSHGQIDFNKSPVENLGEPGAGVALTEKLFNRAAVLLAFEQVGGAQAALEMAKEYALGRFAFGRQIASFQAIKHKLADMYVANTLAESNCYYGAWALQSGPQLLAGAAATARVSATTAFLQSASENIQIHGGMGFTWEFDCHLYYRRSKMLSVNLGSHRRWKNKLISAIEQEREAELA